MALGKTGENQKNDCLKNPEDLKIIIKNPLATMDSTCSMNVCLTETSAHEQRLELVWKI